MTQIEATPTSTPDGIVAVAVGGHGRQREQQSRIDSSHASSKATFSAWQRRPNRTPRRNWRQAAGVCGWRGRGRGQVRGRGRAPARASTDALVSGAASSFRLPRRSSRIGTRIVRVSTVRGRVLDHLLCGLQHGPWPAQSRLRPALGRHRGSRPMTLVAELETHQRPIGPTSCHFTKACSAERGGQSVIKRDGRTIGAGVDRASIEHPCAVLAGPIDSACEERRRDPLSAATSPGYKA
jgi:hypothetical protein